MTSSGGPCPGSTPPRELAHAIAGALTLPNDVADRDELDYLRATRDAHRPVRHAAHYRRPHLTTTTSCRSSHLQAPASSPQVTLRPPTRTARLLRPSSRRCRSRRARRRQASGPTCSRPVSAPAASCRPVAAPSRVLSPQQWTGWFGRNGSGMAWLSWTRSVPRRALPSSGQVRSLQQGHRVVESPRWLISVRGAVRDSWPVRVGLVGVPGLEPGTSSLSGKRSNRLSYTPRRAPGSTVDHGHAGLGYRKLGLHAQSVSLSVTSMPPARYVTRL